MEKTIQLSDYIDTKNTKIILKDTKRYFCCHYSKKSYSQIKKVLLTIKDLFDGKFAGYQKCNTQYHDFEHTIEAYQASLRIMDGYIIEKGKLPEDIARCLLIATLFHDSGYILENKDMGGTGAKYTNTHVDRSIDFLRKHYRDFYIHSKDLELIACLIAGTKFAIDFRTIQFTDPLYKIAGAIVASADLLGQMSNRYYLEKLLFLYYEFKEANLMDFSSEFELIKRTVDFYNIAMEKFSVEFFNMHNCAKSHFKTRYYVNRNLYIEAIQKQMGYLQMIIDDDSSNFRHKLKRNNKFQLVKNSSTSEMVDAFKN